MNRELKRKLKEDTLSFLCSMVLILSCVVVVSML